MNKEIKIECEFSEMKNISELIPHEMNANHHSDEQIDRLAEMFEYYGIRHPILVSTKSNKIVAGHGRFYAAKKLGMTQFPVDYQDFENEDQEIAFLTADNAIALWAELDFSKINQQLADFSPDFNLDMLGIKNFKLDFEPSTKEDQGSIDEKKIVIIQCPHCGEPFDQSQAKTID